MRRGDNNLRSSYGRCMLSLLQQLPGALQPDGVKAVLDLGCATGLSSLALAQLFPAAHVTGVDLSPHMVAVGRHHQQRREVRACARVPATADLAAARPHCVRAGVPVCLFALRRLRVGKRSR